jgi:putative SOS response-associated peptidase YedK
MQAFHNRQPVILDPEEYEEWLSPTDRPPVHLLRILPVEKMHIAPVEIAKLVEPVPVTGNLFE